MGCCTSLVGLSFDSQSVKTPLQATLNRRNAAVVAPAGASAKVAKDRWAAMLWRWCRQSQCQRQMQGNRRGFDNTNLFDTIEEGVGVTVHPCLQQLLPLATR